MKIFLTMILVILISACSSMSESNFTKMKRDIDNINEYVSLNNCTNSYLKCSVNRFIFHRNVNLVIETENKQLIIYQNYSSHSSMLIQMTHKFSSVDTNYYNKYVSLTDEDEEVLRANKEIETIFSRLSNSL